MNRVQTPKGCEYVCDPDAPVTLFPRCLGGMARITCVNLCEIAPLQLKASDLGTEFDDHWVALVAKFAAAPYGKLMGLPEQPVAAAPCLADLLMTLRKEGADFETLGLLPPKCDW